MLESKSPERARVMVGYDMMMVTILGMAVLFNLYSSIMYFRKYSELSTRELALEEMRFRVLSDAANLESRANDIKVMNLEYEKFMDKIEISELRNALEIFKEVKPKLGN